MSYQALYRAWRPQSFSDVVGQEHVTKTLQNALSSSKMSHAYLFSGPRGTGKTSAAKIFAKTVNCEKAPIAEPCNECLICKGITDGSNTDVIEMDAASNNSVDEIRDIRDKVKFAPSISKYKVYIIDEVHMLSVSAFNALLKTLEEPPKHVIFILATTEPHKLPLTVISRCQRFDFKRITAQDIVKRLEYIAAETNLAYEDKVLAIIARAAEGGLRDALSLLDQAISFSQGEVTNGDALTVTGSVAQSFLHKLAEAIYEQNVATAFRSLESLIMEGKDPAKFTEDFILFYRDMLLYQTAPDLEETLERVMLDDEFSDLAKKVTPDNIYAYIDILNDTQQQMKFSNHGQIYLEVAIVKLCQLETKKATIEIPEMKQLMAQIKKMEKELVALKANSSAPNSEEKRPTPRKAQRPGSKFKPQTGRIREILRDATKDDLILIKGRWGNMLEMLNRSQAALLNEAEPVAASKDGFVLKFKYDIHCQMAMDNHTFITAVTDSFQEITNNSYQVLGIPEEQWEKMREDFIQNQQKGTGSEANSVGEEDPLIAEAKKLVGNELVEIQE